MATGNYKPNSAGLRELGQSPKMGAAMVSAAQAGAVWARSADPKGGYEVEPATVTAGWNNEARSGARIVETKRGNGARDRVLVRAVNIIEHA